MSLKLWKRISFKFSVGGFSLIVNLSWKLFLLFLLIELIEGYFVLNFDFGISLSVENFLIYKILFVFGNVDVSFRNFSLCLILIVGFLFYLGCCFSGFVVVMYRKIVSLFIRCLIKVIVYF